ncbi:MAG: hypothetical protein HQK78_03285 [Desulfobacterales bacterium]|nr:hypothetical protein [Desulfobacterales bacterium]
MTDDIFNRLVKDIFNAFGQDAIYMPISGKKRQVRVAIDYKTELQPSGQASVYEIGTTMECILAEIGREPNRGDRFQIGNKVYKVDSIIQNDGRVVKMAVK